MTTNLSLNLAKERFSFDNKAVPTYNYITLPVLQR